VPAQPLLLVETITVEERGALLDRVEEEIGFGTYVWVPGRHIKWSSGMFRLLGMVPGPVDATVAFDRIHPEDRASVVMLWQALGEGVGGGDVEPFEFRLIRPDGVERIVLGGGRMTRDADGSARMVGTMLDITELQEGKVRLAEALALLADTQRAAGIGSYVYDLDTGRLEWSDELYRLMGLEPGTPVDAGLASAVGHADDAARLEEWTARVLAGEAVEPLVVRVRRGDGTYIHLEAISRRVEGPSGRRIVGIASDVTARIEADQQIRNAAKMDAIGTLAAGVAHDFNNYLTVLSVELEAVRSGRRAATPETLAAMSDAVDRCAGLVRQLLAFSRQHPFRPQPVDLAAQVDAVARLFARLADPDVAVRTVLTAPVVVRADPAQLDGALMNLLINARDAMPQGGEVTIELTEQALAAGRFARLRVRDTGAGIPAAVLPRIFEPYFTTKAPGAGSGLGLGLAAVYGTVHQHDGWVDVISTEGQGAIFDVFLPVAGGALPRTAVGSTPPVMRLRVLLVEDVPQVRAALASLLEDEGHLVEEAADGEDALERVRAGAGFDLVLSDVVMPRLGGAALVDALAELAPDLPVILMSGASDPRGCPIAAAWLDKPFSREALLAAIAEVRRGKPPGYSDS